MSQLQDFIAAVKNDGLARTNLYGIQFTLPFLPQLQQYQNFADRVASLYASRVDVPTMRLETEKVANIGEPYQIATVRRFEEDFTVDFYLDSQYQTLNLFHTWFQAISDPESKNVGYLDDYSTSLVVFANGRQQSNVCNYVFEKAYPKSVKTKSYAHNDASFQVVSVSFAYYRFIYINSVSGTTFNSNTSILNQYMPFTSSPYLGSSLDFSSLPAPIPSPF